jgi:RNA polymerase sigma-70 factor (ECF subfamily)
MHSTPANEFARTALIHVPDVYRVARRLCGDADVAGDLTQETFLQAWQSFHRFELGTNCRAWLYRILLHVWSHERRRRTREPILFDSDAAELGTPFYDPPVPDNLTAPEVLEALDRLPPAHRNIVILADVEDLSYREIAEILEIPIGTVMSRLSRARRVLRQDLADHARGLGIGLRAAGNRDERER